MKHSKPMMVISLLMICAIGLTFVANKEITRVYKTLTGESKHWELKYVARGYLEFYKESEVLNSKSIGVYKLKLTYKGTSEEIKALRTVSVNMLTGTCSITESAPDDLQYTLSGNLDTHTIIEISKHHPIEFQVTWDDQTESIELR